MSSKTDLGIVKDSSWDGIVGLGYWFDNHQTTPKSEVSIVDNIISNKVLEH